MRRRPLAITVVLLATSVVALSAHLKVEKSLPATDATVTKAPEQVRVWFSQAPTLAISALTLEGPSGPVALGKVAAGQTDGKADHSLVAAVAGPMSPGRYTVGWKTSGHDGHIQTGTFAFTYAADR